MCDLPDRPMPVIYPISNAGNAPPIVSRLIRSSVGREVRWTGRPGEDGRQETGVLKSLTLAMPSSAARSACDRSTHPIGQLSMRETPSVPFEVLWIALTRSLARHRRLFPKFALIRSTRSSRGRRCRAHVGGMEITGTAVIEPCAKGDDVPRTTRQTSIFRKMLLS